MIKIYSQTRVLDVDSTVELGLYHGGLIYIARDGHWYHDDYMQLTAESARELAAALNKWADDDDELANKLDVR